MPAGSKAGLHQRVGRQKGEGRDRQSCERESAVYLLVSLIAYKILINWAAINNFIHH